MKIEKLDKFVPIKPLVNKVEKSALQTIDLELFYPTDPRYAFDLKDYLFKGMILKEKDFRQSVQEHDWAQYQDGVLLVFNSADAIIPMWAYMLISTSAADYVKTIFHGTEAEYISVFYKIFIENFDVSPYQDGKIMLKGCGKKPIPPAAYMEMTHRLKPIVNSLMFGEACSNVPIYKKNKN